MRKLLVPLLAATLTFAAGCNSDATSPTVSITGNWSLRTLNGQSLPIPAGNASIMSEQLTLNPDGSYNDVVNYSDGTFATEQGFYTVNNNLITFSANTGFQYTGSISGNVLTSTFIDERSGTSFTSVYQKT